MNSAFIKQQREFGEWAVALDLGCRECSLIVRMLVNKAGFNKKPSFNKDGISLDDMRFGCVSRSRSKYGYVVGDCKRIQKLTAMELSKFITNDNFRHVYATGPITLGRIADAFKKIGISVNIGYPCKPRCCHCGQVLRNPKSK